METLCRSTSPRPSYLARVHAFYVSELDAGSVGCLLGAPGFRPPAHL
jgi:hypothetical protein